MERTHVISDSELVCGTQAVMVNDGTVRLGTIMQYTLKVCSS